MCKTTPSGDTLRELGRERGLSEPLLDLIVTRYQEHCSEYITSPPAFDGKNANALNLCMFKDNLQDVEEELTDATFNALIYLMRTEGKRGRRLLSYLASTWDVLQEARKAEVEA